MQQTGETGTAVKTISKHIQDGQKSVANLDKTPLARWINQHLLMLKSKCIFLNMHINI